MRTLPVVAGRTVMYVRHVELNEYRPKYYHTSNSHLCGLNVLFGYFVNFVNYCKHHNTVSFFFVRIQTQSQFNDVDRPNNIVAKLTAHTIHFPYR